MIDLDGLDGVTRLGSGKVREIWQVDGQVLLVATDRLSAYDVVLPTPVPDKGRVLTGLSAFWFDHLRGLMPDHRVTTDVAAFPAVLQGRAAALRGRAMLCRKADVIPVECVARGYLAGSAWAEYRGAGTVGGTGIRAGLVESEELPEPLFTPTTKARGSHDEPLAFDELVARVGGELAERLRQVTLDLYCRARSYAAGRGILLADTKLEFGRVDGELTLVDEVFTPDSSRFWPADGYQPGIAQESFDKQYVRDWLTRLGWDRTPPGPELPREVVQQTRERYVAAYEQLSGRRLEDWEG